MAPIKYDPGHVVIAVSCNFFNTDKLKTEGGFAAINYDRNDKGS